jgi:RimJ/RimL family protein N-acetyltransferase
MSNSTVEILRLPVSDRSGEYEMSVRRLQNFGQPESYLDRTKITELWKLYSEHETLFSDHTEGRLEPFLDMLMNPRSIWFEFYHTEQEAPVGVAYLTRIIPFFDAEAHLAFWDGIASGRQPVVWELMDMMFEEFNLRRISAAIPVYQSGTIRFVKKLGFQEEGTRRDAVLKHGGWFPQTLLGILREELEQARETFMQKETNNG